MSMQVEHIAKHASIHDLAIRIRVGNYIGINKTVLRALNHPKYLTFWWGEQDKVLAIGVSDILTETSVPVPKHFYYSDKGCRLMNWKLLKAIQAYTGWEDNSTHRLIGEFIQDLSVIVFKTDDQE
ncbi:hypothetical protein LJC63_11920 [Ruminococcaceae bacterium OttesenSCG-928-L11]|nr:hypothetical protein [Ruminococcaceae bacterium OttesenSCG-928-L11]